MPTAAAYVIVVLVWATTPLAIKWSAEAGAPVGSVLLRMAFAFLAGLVVLMAMRRGLRRDKQAMKSYAAAVPGVFGAMALSYHASMTLPSGMMSVMFGMAPLVSGLILQLLPGAVKLRRWHWFGCTLGVLGLAVVFADSLVLGSDQLPALLMMLLAVTLFSASGIAVQRVAAGLGPLEQTLGALALSLPCFLVLWLASGEPLTVPLSSRGLWSVIYLALFGSLLGFLCYFLILSRLSAATVALVTLITPVLALGLGMIFNQEQPSSSMLTGAVLILVALGAYLFGDQLARLKVERELQRPRGS
ncbi:DMT family transporter [Halomonas sp. MCCC 1A17488]|uniref:DMT family transporter n=1 Tax=unclassified Halomonas TaxID=2609666 RepID=UPI0018D215A5|nr:MULTISPECIES: DMT family transporter [unclassified Halomonas]MCE8017147.1 DMT family transporter [Halomonas sp. MCCC 1A17488]MCG3240480.1 DMT family transporter [Halomonas sp. MCCC 1A17488]QPP49661.1 DMT family transporter [Halomonas sp. SS10-MC5]